jgi:hypothetical protein
MSWASRISWHQFSAVWSIELGVRRKPGSRFCKKRINQLFCHSGAFGLFRINFAKNLRCAGSKISSTLFLLVFCSQIIAVRNRFFYLRLTPGKCRLFKVGNPCCASKNCHFAKLVHQSRSRCGNPAVAHRHHQQRSIRVTGILNDRGIRP